MVEWIQDVPGVRNGMDTTADATEPISTGRNTTKLRGLLVGAGDATRLSPEAVQVRLTL